MAYGLNFFVAKNEISAPSPKVVRISIHNSTNYILNFRKCGNADYKGANAYIPTLLEYGIAVIYLT